MLYILIGLLTLSCILYVYFYEQITKKDIFVFKVVTSLILLILGYYIFLTKNNQKTYDYFIIIGLSCGFLGDIFLGLRNLLTKCKVLLFIIGIVLFMIGHIGYINAMFTLFKGNTIYLVILVILLLTFIIIFTKLTRVKFGKTIIICHTYSLLSCVFLSISIFNAFILNKLSIYIVLLGTFSFVLSDFLLSYLYFSSISEGRRKKFKRINIISYYLGQVILVLSMIAL